MLTKITPVCASLWVRVLPPVRTWASTESGTRTARATRLVAASHAIRRRPMEKVAPCAHKLQYRAKLVEDAESGPSTLSTFAYASAWVSRPKPTGFGSRPPTPPIRPMTGKVRIGGRHRHHHHSRHRWRGFRAALRSQGPAGPGPGRNGVRRTSPRLVAPLQESRAAAPGGRPGAARCRIGPRGAGRGTGGLRSPP